MATVRGGTDLACVNAVVFAFLVCCDLPLLPVKFGLLLRRLVVELGLLCLKFRVEFVLFLLRLATLLRLFSSCPGFGLLRFDRFRFGRCRCALPRQPCCRVGGFVGLGIIACFDRRPFFGHGLVGPNFDGYHGLVALLLDIGKHRVLDAGSPLSRCSIDDTRLLVQHQAVGQIGFHAELLQIQSRDRVQPFTERLKRVGDLAEFRKECCPREQRLTDIDHGFLEVVLERSLLKQERNEDHPEPCQCHKEEDDEETAADHVERVVPNVFPVESDRWLNFNDHGQVRHPVFVHGRDGVLGGVHGHHGLPVNFPGGVVEEQAFRQRRLNAVGGD